MTTDLWNRKRLLYQLSHNHCPVCLRDSPVEDDVGEPPAERVVGRKVRIGELLNLLPQQELERFLYGDVAALDDGLLICNSVTW